MSKKSARRKSSSKSGLYIVIGLGALMIVLALIMMSGGFAAPTQASSAEALARCNGKPCPAKGDPNAPVTMIEFSDYACHNCRDYNVATAPIIDREYIDTGKVRYVSHVFALWPESRPAAAAALCASEQGKYWEFHAQAFANFRPGGFPSRDDFLRWASLAGLDADALRACVESGRYDQDAQLSAFEAQRAGVDGTPAFLINGELIKGNVPLAQIRAALDAALAEQ